LLDWRLGSGGGKGRLGGARVVPIQREWEWAGVARCLPSRSREGNGGRLGRMKRRRGVRYGVGWVPSGGAGVGVWPRLMDGTQADSCPTTARGRCWRCPNKGGEPPLTHGPQPVARGRGRCGEQGCVGWPRGMRSGSGPKKQLNFLFIQIIFEHVQIVLIKRWTYQASKITNKICIWRESNREQIYLYELLKIQSIIQIKNSRKFYSLNFNRIWENLIETFKDWRNLIEWVPIALVG
jgi:hypothetical protein